MDTHKQTRKHAHTHIHRQHVCQGTCIHTHTQHNRRTHTCIYTRTDTKIQTDRERERKNKIYTYVQQVEKIKTRNQQDRKEFKAFSEHFSLDKTMLNSLIYIEYGSIQPVYDAYRRVYHRDQITSLANCLKKL